MILSLEKAARSPHHQPVRRIVGTNASGAAPAGSLKIQHFQIVAGITVANHAYSRSRRKALWKIVAVESFRAGGGGQVGERHGARHSFNEGSIYIADSVQDDGVG